MTCVSIAKCAGGETIKVYQYDDHDFQVLVSGSVKVPEIFCSAGAGIMRARETAERVNGIKVSEVVF